MSITSSSSGARNAIGSLCEAYRDWRLSRRPGKSRGALLAESAAAVVLSREGDLEFTGHEGAPVFRQRDAATVLQRLHADLVPTGPVDIVIGGANGTSADAIESRVLADRFPQAEVYHPKLAFGETPGAGALLQVVIAALALRKGGLPGTSGKPPHSALVTALGFNQQAGAALLRKAP